jgi:RNA polymerase sigma-70 factor (ECF subfamily)
VESLIERAVAGDRVALDMVLLHYHEPVRRHIEESLRGSNTAQVSADDVLQETLVAVFRNLGQFKAKGPGSFEAWLRTIAKSRLLNMVKAANALKRGGGRRQENSPLGDDAATSILSLIVGSDATPSRIVRHKEALEAVSRAVAGLDEEKRRILELRFGQQLSVAEVAAVIGKRESAVKMMIHRVIKDLRREIDLLGEFSAGV